MFARECKTLSQEEMRKRLYQTFKNKGVLDSLKTQLRNQLIHELKHQAFGGGPAYSSEDLHKDSLLHKASNSLVVDHLARCGYEYSLSVFYPECGLEKEKVFTVDELLQLMQINPKSTLYKTLRANLHDRNGKGLLFQMITEMTNYTLHKESRDADTQTLATSSYKESIVEKFQFIDEQFQEMYPKRPKFESLEGKLSLYRREMEEQLQMEMSQKLQHFKDIEIAKIKLKEKEKSQKEIAECRRELEKAYQLKLDGLVSREKNATERIQRQQEVETKEMYSQRQALLKDVELVRRREVDLRQRMEDFELAKKLQEEKNKSVDDLLRKRELEVRNIEDIFEQKLKNELLRHQIKLKEEYLMRTQKVSADEGRNKDEAARLREEAIVMNLKKQEMGKAISRTQDLEIEVDALKVQLSLLTRQNNNLTERLKETIDYPLILAEKVEFETQNKVLKQQLDDVRKENQLLREGARQPVIECASLQEELKRLLNARQFDQEEFKIQRDIMEKRLQTEVEKCAALKMQLVNSEDSARRLSAEVEQLEFQLRHTRQAFEKEVYRNPKPSLLDRSVLDLTSNRTVSPYIFVDKAVLKSQLVLDPSVETGGTFNSHYRHSSRTRSSSPDSDFEFVANTKAIIKELEKDAEFLDEAYRLYQERLIQGADIESISQSTAPPTRRQFNMASAASLPRVNFFDDNLTPQQQILLNRLKTQRYDGLMTAEDDRHIITSKISSQRRLSSTPVSKVEQNSSEKETALSEVTDHNGSFIPSPHHSPNQQLSPIPNVNQSAALNSNVPPPLCTETEKDLAFSVHKLTESDPDELTDNLRPKTLHFEDLNHSNSSLQEDIPEQLECDVSYPLEHLIQDNPINTNVPGTVSPQLDSSKTSSEKSINHEGTEERSNQTDTPSDSGDQQEEYHSLEKENDPMENLMMEPNLSEAEGKKSEENLWLNEPEEVGTSAKIGVSPLDKYIQMLSENRVEEQSEKVVKESFEELSLVEQLSNESITALSHGEADDDFW
ncbi:centriole and centriolar satellite protein OFD1 [Pelodytes ibericus]